MKAAELVGVITTFILGMFGYHRLAGQDRRKASSDNAAALLNGWQQLQESVVRDVERVRTACAREVADLKEKFEVDRAEWRAERLALQTRVGELQAEVLALVNRPAVARTRRTDLATIARIIDGDTTVVDTQGGPDD